MNVPQSLSRFTLETCLGEGGFGSVYRAIDARLARAVAVKIVHRDHRRVEGESLLRNEYLLLSRLHHPNTVAALDFHVDPSLGPTLVLELFDGEPLDRFSATATTEELLNAFIQLTRSVNFLHSKGLVHGDLKPENILVQRLRTAPCSERADNLLLKVIDLGFAASPASNHPLPQRGTVPFVAPEVLAGSNADHRADLYALGALILQSLTASSIVPRDDRRPIITDALRAHSAPPTFLRTLARELTAIKPSNRPQTAADVLEILSSKLNRPIPIETPAGMRACLRSADIVGRDSELLSLLDSCSLRTTRTPSSLLPPSVILIHGEAGIGKTRLIDELLIRLKIADMPTHRGKCPERGASPFHPFGDLLGNPGTSIVIADDGQSQLSQHSDRSSFPQDDGWSQVDRIARLEAVAELVATRADKARLVMICEDLQFADEDTFEVFLRLLGRARFASFTLLATFRTEGLLAERLKRLIESHLSKPHIHSLQLRRFDPQETEEFLRRSIGAHRALGSLATFAQGVTSGNPLFLHELMRGLLDTQTIDGGPFRWEIKMPAAKALGTTLTLTKLVHGRIKSLSHSELNLLEWLSAIDQPATTQFLHEASGLPYPELCRLIDSLLRTGILTDSNEGTASTFTFSHELYRKAVYEALSSNRRADLHRSIGVALERLSIRQTSEGIARLAFHFLRAAEPRKGPLYAKRAAADAQRNGATFQAIALYHDCLDVLDDKELDLRYELLATIAGLLRHVGDMSRAEAFYLEILLTARKRLDQKREALALRRIGRIHADRGDLIQARAFVEKALDLDRAAGDPAAEAESILIQGMVASKSGEYEQSLDLARQATELSQRYGNRVIYGLSANLAGLCLTSLRRHAAAIEEFRTWLRVAEEEGDVISGIMALSNIGWVYLERGLLNDADKFFDECLSRINDKGLECTAITAAVNSGEVLRYRGEFGRSRARLQQGLASAERAGRCEVVQYAVYSIGLLDLEAGALGEAEVNINRAFRASEDMGARAAAAQALVGIGELELRRDNPVAAERAFSSCLERNRAVNDQFVMSSALSGLSETMALPGLSWASLNTSAHTGLSAPRSASRKQQAEGDLEEGKCAHELSEQAFLIARSIDSRQAMVRADLAGALAYLAEGDTATSLERAQRAIELCDSCGFRPDKARALLAAGMAHAAAGRLKDARHDLEASLALADEIGVAMVRARARAELVPILDAQSQWGRAETIAREGADLLKAMARTLPDADDRHRFMSVQWRKEVLARAAAGDPVQPATLGRTLATPATPGPDQPTRGDSTPTQLDTALGSSAPADPPEADPAASRGHDLAPPALQPNSGAARGDLRSSVTSLLGEALQSIECDRGMVFLIAPDGSTEIVVASGLESESVEDARSYCRSVVDRAAHGEEIFVTDTSRDDRFRDRRSVGLFHIVSVICVPLRIATRVIGALYLDSRAGGRLLRHDDLRAARRVSNQIATSIHGAWERERSREEALLLQKELCKTYRLDAIIGDSVAMRKCFRVLEAVIASDCNVLLVGESGTGKELAARAIHFSGRRKMAPFLPVDCGALQDSLVESELFGYRRGAFTGADADKRGLFEEADGGTLFLDEITNTSTLFQAKLLRVLQSGEFRRVGDPAPRRVDVRIIAATNAEPEKAMSRGRFREDLYYRLNVVTVRMPALRERPEDIAILAERFARKFCDREKIPYRGLGESALGRLLDHDWPGNVRELKNAVESALVLSRDGAVRREFLPENLRGGSFREIRSLLREGAAEIGEGLQERTPCAAEDQAAQAPTAALVDTASGAGHDECPTLAPRPEGFVTAQEQRAAREADERSRVEAALRRAGGDKSLAAKILGCSRMTLYRRLRRLGIDYKGQESTASKTS